MILTKLKEFAETRLDLPPEMYGKTKVRWWIELNPQSQLVGFTPRGGDSKATQRGLEQTVPKLPKKRTVAIQPVLLADTGEYVLGIPKEGSKLERVSKCHQQFKELVQACVAATKDPAVQTILNFLNNWDPSQAQLPEGFDPSDVVTFRIGKRIPADANPENQAIQEFWARYTAGGDEEESSLPVMMCLVTGQETQVVDRLPEPIKGIPDGQPSGTSLVSANADAFTSYGLKNSLTSPISRSAAEKFGKALNYLLAEEHTHLRVGSSVFVFWTRDPEEFDFFSYLDKPQAADVQNLLKSALKGEKNYSVQGHENEFYALSLTANNARAVVRSWLQTTVPDVQRHLKQWFQDQQIVDPYGQPSKPFGIYALAASAYRDPAKEMQPTVPTALLRCALSGDPLPDSLLTRATRRIAVEGEIPHARAALLKLILLSHWRRTSRPMPDLEALNLNPELDPPDQAAYHCGRLFAQLEIIQRAAQRGINTTLVDRYYSAASTTPKKILGDLIAKAQPHLAKIRKDSKGTYEALERQLEEILVRLDPAALPTSLTMQQQSLFGLGYYHQRADNRRRAAEGAEKKKQSQMDTQGELNHD
ncbi:type I-C CRISPR-associated protein Cas8c/Csd1 [Thermostichus vulcanus]|uniref:Type I-C CRISPR-associated protein Cas8c/Csd1 n=1 Tax=Thermostichus vulcanus str. 'Rupite' TaxID=2813851 RepID=A0ABT0CBC7_THEVL|nr:type I-C CRISPR-associated protein Cas8c/Csd1 [Thermostichus vulcanus]MCJ2543092.1 type I-C CRISPR-associated protein Cas8c/Csd1 [Thermostichus vulcanus str. 'Rupite']